MDNKTIFVRTSKGEEQVQSRTSPLSGDIKRALSMVDGTASFGEISKRSAPSMRANLAEMFEELKKNGLIHEKSFAGKIPKTAAPPKMVVPLKMAIPRKNPGADKVDDELDFMSGYTSSSQQAPRAATDEISRREIEAGKLKAQQEAEAILRKAEEDARLRLEAAKREREEAELSRLKAEQEAKRVREELEAAKRKAEQEARLRFEAAEKERREAEAARIKAEQEAKRVRDELEAAKRKAEQEARLRFEAAEKERKAAEAARIKAEQEAARIKAEQEAARKKAEQEAREQARIKSEEEAAKAREAADRARGEADMLNAATTARSTGATVLFFDVVGYTKQSVSKQIEIKNQFNHLVSECLKTHHSGDYIILDTGDGAAIGFLQYPEDALEVAIAFRKAVMANNHADYPDLKMRIGIHLGPVNIAKDMNGRNNMVGDGINDAQRVMNFAGVDKIYISRPYYDYVSRLNDEYADMFVYRGRQRDKHGREHSVYELVDAASAEEVLQQQASDSGQNPFSFDSFQLEQALSPSGAQGEKQPANKNSPATAEAAEAKLDEFAIDSFAAVEPASPVEPQKVQQPVKESPSKESIEREQLKREAQARNAEEARAKEMADAQAKVWADAEQRALEAAKANAAQVALRAEHPPETARAAKPAPAARAPRKPFAWGKLRSAVLMLVTFLLVVLVAALFIVPYFLPLRDYMPKVQQMLSDELHQPVHLGYMSGRILPTPRLDLGEIYIGDAKQFQAATAQINFDIMGVFEDNKPIDSVDFQKVQVRGIGLTDSAAWLQKLAADRQYPVSRMTISEGTLDADAFQLTGVEGELNFNTIGEFTVGKLSANSGKYTVAINGAPKNKLMAAITVHGSALPLLPNWTFDELDAKGEISSGALLISDFKAKILGGKLQGNARIDWHSGWHAEGTLTAKQIVMNNFGKLLDGNADGSAHFKMGSKDLAGLTDSAEMDGSFTSTGGLLSGLDIIETARRHSKENMPGGRTHYDRLSGHFTYTNDVYHFTQVKIDAGVLNASATFDINKQQLSGNMKVHLDLHDVTTTNLKLGGAIDDPTLVYEP